MTHSFDGYNHLIRLEMGERLGEALERFAAEANVDGAWLSGLGAASNIVLGFYQLSTKAFKTRTFGQTMEVVSLTGNLAVSEAGKVEYHLHGMFADEDYQTVGGHVQDLVVGATLELFVHRSYKPMYRKHDDTTGLQLLGM
jgi:predicted DNA-binding protein with PD1-like motif